MSSTTFDGPIRVGEIRDTTGTQLGLNVQNTGFVEVVQASAISQAAATSSTTVVIPAGSLITAIDVYVTAVWTGAATTFGIGVVGDATRFTAAGAISGAALGRVAAATPSTLAQTNAFINTGTSDVRVLITNTNTGTGAARIVVRYVPQFNLSNPTI